MERGSGWGWNRVDGASGKGTMQQALERPTFKFGLWNLGTGILSGFSPFPELIRVAPCHSAVFVNTMMYVEHWLAIQEPGMLACAR